MQQLEQFQNDSSKGTPATIEIDYSYAVVPGSTMQPEQRQSQTSNYAAIETMYEDVKDCHPFPNKDPLMPTEGTAEYIHARVSKKSKKPNTAVAAPETSPDLEEIQKPAQPAQTTVPPATPAPYKGEAHMFAVATTTHITNIVSHHHIYTVLHKLCTTTSNNFKPTPTPSYTTIVHNSHI